MKKIHVSAGILCRNGKILLCSRTGKKEAEEFWEFPGGKCEKGERVSECLKRELYEELGCHIAVLDKLGENCVVLGERSYHLHFLRFILLPGSPEPLPQEGQSMQWVALKDLEKVNILPGDRQIAAFLAKSGNFF
jgi:8-oxo-dGTP diphosphatase